MLRFTEKVECNNMIILKIVDLIIYCIVRLLNKAPKFIDRVSSL